MAEQDRKPTVAETLDADLQRAGVPRSQINAFTRALNAVGGDKQVEEEPQPAPTGDATPGAPVGSPSDDDKSDGDDDKPTPRKRER